MSRIPVGLQAVFLASNRGQEVHKPPPGKVASRIFTTFFKSRQNADSNDRPRKGKASWWTRPTKRNAQKQTQPKQEQPQQHSISTPMTTSTTLDASHITPMYHDIYIPPIATIHEDENVTSPVRDIYIPHLVSPKPKERSNSNASTASSKKSRRRSSKIKRHNQENFHLNDDISTTSSITFHMATSDHPKRLYFKSNSKRKSIRKKYTPQSYLDAILQNRGYSTQRYEVLKSGYYNTTTQYQQMSYHVYVVDLVKNNQTDTIKSLFCDKSNGATGISTNPANSYGEGLINLVCRLGLVDILKIMLSAGCDIQVSDDFGRTPMHDACWAKTPAFDVVEMLLDIDPHLMFMMDVRGSLPLSYVQENDHEAWINFLSYKVIDRIWPVRSSLTSSSMHTEPPPLTLQLPNSRPVPDPINPLPTIFLQMLASGRMSPKEIASLQDDDDDDDDDETDSDFEEEDFDQMDNVSFGRVSCSGYTFNFSDESSSDEDDDNSSTNSSSSSLPNENNDERNALKVDALDTPDDRTEDTERLIEAACKGLNIDDTNPRKPSVELVDTTSTTEPGSNATTPHAPFKNRPGVKPILSGSTWAETCIVSVRSHECVDDQNPASPMRSISFDGSNTDIDKCNCVESQAIIEMIPVDRQTLVGINYKSIRKIYCVPENDDGLLAGSC